MRNVIDQRVSFFRLIRLLFIRQAMFSNTNFFNGRAYGIIIQSPKLSWPKKTHSYARKAKPEKITATKKHNISVAVMIIYRGQLVPVLVHLFQSWFADAAPHSQQDHTRENQHAHGEHCVAYDEDSTCRGKRQSPALPMISP